MAVRRIVLMDEPILRRKARKVKQFDARLRELADDMVETMRQADGVGLAAPQVGVSDRLIVVQIPEEYQDDPHAGELFVLVNPRIVSASEEQLAGDEGCLSVPGIVGQVNRARQVSLRAQDTKGKPIRLEAEGFLARAFQHEIDHLDGVLFLDRVENPETLRRITPEGEVVPIEVPA